MAAFGKPNSRASGLEKAVWQLSSGPHGAGRRAAFRAYPERAPAAAAKRLLELCPRVVALGGGGYNLSSVTRMWALAYAAMLGVGRDRALDRGRLSGIDWANGVTFPTYWLVSTGQGRGLMTQCCRAFYDHAFSQLQVRRIIVAVATGNLPGQKLPLRLGFKLTPRSIHRGSPSPGGRCSRRWCRPTSSAFSPTRR